MQQLTKCAKCHKEIKRLNDKVIIWTCDIHSFFEVDPGLGIQVHRSCAKPVMDFLLSHSMKHNPAFKQEAEECGEEFLDQLKRFPLQVSRVNSPEERLFMLAHHFYDLGLVHARLHGITPSDVALVLSRLTGYFKVAGVPIDQIEPDA